MTYGTVQPLMPFTQLPSQTASVKKPSAQNIFPVALLSLPVPTQSNSIPISNPTTTITSHLMQSVTMQSNITAGKYFHI
jgi:hypothetical protein